MIDWSPMISLRATQAAGVFATRGNVDVISAQIMDYFSLTVALTSAGKTVDCPLIEWNATVNWPKGGSPTGIAIVTGINQ